MKEQIVMTGLGLVLVIEYHVGNNLDWIQHHMAPEIFPLDTEPMLIFNLAFGYLLIAMGYIYSMIKEKKNNK